MGETARAQNGLTGYRAGLSPKPKGLVSKPNNKGTVCMDQKDLMLVRACVGSSGHPNGAGVVICWRWWTTLLQVMFHGWCKPLVHRRTKIR
ncbi:hypothetical protein PS1_033090 [Malus domestica]|uniref:Uncharacterized protein n=1 Tax=Malus domestica TaxID=3750 RepID=A0A498K1Z5_MALDO|nr:hypothetical protein DVH24_014756 [Malus domestica]